MRVIQRVTNDTSQRSINSILTIVEAHPTISEASYQERESPFMSQMRYDQKHQSPLDDG